MKKNNLKVLVVAAVAVMIGLTRCKKCYECSAPSGGFWCHKGGDSIGVYAVHGRAIEDSLRYYRNLGYICDTSTFYYSDNGVYFNPICGRQGYNTAMNAHDKCEPIK